VCIQHSVLTVLFRWLSVVLVGLDSNPTRTTDTITMSEVYSDIRLCITNFTWTIPSSRESWLCVFWYNDEVSSNTHMIPAGSDIRV
jgi:hypothetical protein